MKVYIQKGTVGVEVPDCFDNLDTQAVNKLPLEDGWELVSPACDSQDWVVLAQSEQDGPDCRLRRRVILHKENIALHFRKPLRPFEGLTWIPGFVICAYRKGVDPVFPLRRMGITAD